MPFEIAIGGGDGHEVTVTRHGARATVSVDGRAIRASLRPLGDAYELTVDEHSERMWIVVDRDTIHVHAFGRAWQLSLVDPVERARAGGHGGDLATAPMPGTVITVATAAGEEVTEGQSLVVIESMKMQSEITATRDGVVERVFLDVGDTFERGAALVSLVPLDDAEEAA